MRKVFLIVEHLPLSVSGLFPLPHSSGVSSPTSRVLPEGILRLQVKVQRGIGVPSKIDCTVKLGLKQPLKKEDQNWLSRPIIT